MSRSPVQCRHPKILLNLASHFQNHPVSCYLHLRNIRIPLILALDLVRDIIDVQKLPVHLTMVAFVSIHGFWALVAVHALEHHILKVVRCHARMPSIKAWT
jgi:hypothetical protein